MSRGWRLWLFALLCLPLAAAAAALIALGPSERPGETSSTDQAADPGTYLVPGEAGHDHREEPSPKERLEAAAKARVAPAERPDPVSGATGEAAETLEAGELLRQTKAEAEPVARRFFAALARYELGKATPAVVAAIGATASPEFGEILIENPPRIPPASELPPVATLRRLQIQLIGSENTNRKLGSIALRGRLERGDGSHELVIEMSRDGVGIWRVEGLAR